MSELVANSAALVMFSTVLLLLIVAALKNVWRVLEGFEAVKEFSWNVTRRFRKKQRKIGFY